MPGAVDEWEIVRDAGRLQALEREWDDLWERAGDAFSSQRFAWCWASWTKVAQPLGRRLHCLVARSNGTAVLIWPFVVYRYGPWKRARPLAPEVAEYGGVLVERDAMMDARIADAWRTLCRTVRCDTILLPYVPVGTALHRFMSRLRRPMLTQVTAISSARRASDADAAAIDKMLGSRSLARHRRRFEKHGELRSERVTDPGRRTEIIAWTMQQKLAWLTRTGNTKLWHSTELYRDFLTALAGDERLEVFALFLNGVPVASCVARVDNVRFEQFLSSYDPTYRPYSPGQLLRVEAMAWSFEHGLEYDLRVGDHEYKKDWTNHHSQAVSYHVATSRWGLAAIGARRALQAVKRAGRDPAPDGG